MVQIPRKTGHHRPASDDLALNAGLVALCVFRGSGLRNHIPLLFEGRGSKPSVCCTRLWART